MAIAVFRALSIRDGQLVEEGALPRRFRIGDVCAVLTNLGQRGDGSGPVWELSIEIGRRGSARRVLMPLQPFLTSEEYRESAAAPLPFARLDAELAQSIKGRNITRLWLYRDTIYVAERPPQPSELDEVVLRVKALHFQHDEGLKRLREQVANFEAVDDNLRNDSSRRTIPDDVKLLVWSRDKGACVKSGASRELHFDHVIALSRGGSDEVENIQLLCRRCNLAKGDRLV